LPVTTLTAGELRRCYDALDVAEGLLPGDSQALLHKLERMIAEASAVRIWGAVVFEWRLPLALAPTMNRYGSMKTWQRAKLYKALDVLIMAELHKWPQWRHEGRARAVRVTRYSSSELDEATVDCAGGKVPVDRLVRAGILRGDAPNDLAREARWNKWKPGQGCVFLEVFALA
jgi:hypothetical protein